MDGVLVWRTTDEEDDLHVLIHARSMLLVREAICMTRAGGQEVVLPSGMELWRVGDGVEGLEEDGVAFVVQGSAAVQHHNGLLVPSQATTLVTSLFHPVDNVILGVCCGGVVVRADEVDLVRKVHLDGL